MYVQRECKPHKIIIQFQIGIHFVIMFLEKAWIHLLWVNNWVDCVLQQSVLKKENSIFKLTLLRLKIDLVSHSACSRGLSKHTHTHTHLYIYIYIYKENFGSKWMFSSSFSKLLTNFLKEKRQGQFLISCRNAPCIWTKKNRSLIRLLWNPVYDIHPSLTAGFILSKCGRLTTIMLNSFPFTLLQFLVSSVTLEMKIMDSSWPGNRWVKFCSNDRRFFQSKCRWPRNGQGRASRNWPRNRTSAQINRLL